MVENIWLLMLGPLVVGLIAYGLASLLPPIYESVAVLQPRPPASLPTGKNPVMLNPNALTPAFANAVATKMATPDALDKARQAVLQAGTPASGSALNASVRATVGANDNLVTLTVRSSSPSAAQQLASAILAHTYADSRPKSAELKRLTAEHTHLKQQIAELELTTQKVQASIERHSTNPELSDLANTHALISANLVEMHRRLQEIDVQLEGITEEAVVQTPTLPTQPSSPRKLIIAFLSAIGVAFLLLIIIFVRQSWRATGTSSLNEQRLHALKRRYGLAR